MLQTPLCSGQSADFTPRKLYSTRDASWRVKLALHHWLKISSGIFVLIIYSCIFFSFLFFFYFHFLPVLVHQGKLKRLPLFSSTDCPIKFFIKIGLFDTRRQARTRGGGGGLETRSCTFFMHQLNSQTDSTFVVVFSKERPLEKRWEGGGRGIYCSWKKGNFEIICTSKWDLILWNLLATFASHWD